MRNCFNLRQDEVVKWEKMSSATLLKTIRMDSQKKGSLMKIIFQEFFDARKKNFFLSFQGRVMTKFSLVLLDKGKWYFLRLPRFSISRDDKAIWPNAITLNWIDVCLRQGLWEILIESRVEFTGIFMSLLSPVQCDEVNDFSLVY